MRKKKCGHKAHIDKIIEESIRHILFEGREFPDLDISTIDIEDLKKGYKDYRLVPTSALYGDVLLSPSPIKEAVGDILPPDELADRIIKKYGIPPSFVSVHEHFHKICIYIVTAMIGVNDKYIIDDMSKAGYFVGHRQTPQVLNGMKFQVLQFEPESQQQSDVTDEVKGKYSFLFHWTPSYNLKEIARHGLIPSHKNEKFDYPSRTYLMNGDSNDRQLLGLGQELCSYNNNAENNGEYALLRIEISDLDEAIRFFYDPNSEIGIYTEQRIPKDKIGLVKKIQFFKR